MVTTVHGQLRATGGLGGLALTKEAQGRSEGGAVQAGAGAGPGAEAGEVREAVQRRRAGWADPCRPRPAQRGAVLCVAAPQPGSAAWRKGIQTARWPAHAVKPLLKSPGRPSGRRWEGQAKGHARVRRTERRRAQAAAVARVGARAGCVTHRRGCMAPPVPVCVCVRGRGGGCAAPLFCCRAGRRAIRDAGMLLVPGSWERGGPLHRPAASAPVD